MNFDLKWAAIATLLPGVSGSGFLGLAPNGDPLSRGDLALLRQAIAHVLDSNSVGAAADWRGNDGNAGRATLVRIYVQDGRPCGEVEHKMNWGADARYLFTLCKLDGEWKFAP